MLLAFFRERNPSSHSIVRGENPEAAFKASDFGAYSSLPNTSLRFNKRERKIEVFCRGMGFGYGKPRPISSFRYKILED